MPPRAVSLAIVVFWLAAMSWLFVRDLWPVIRPSTRPPFTIDLEGEASTRPGGNLWSVYRNGIRVGHANTSTRYFPTDQTYQLRTEIRFERFRYSLLSFELEVTKMKSVYRVTRTGELRELESHVEIKPSIRGVAVEQKVLIDVQGRVEDGLFSPHWRVKAPAPIGDRELHTDPVEVPAHDSILNPLQPWNRLLHVTPGQRGDTSLFSPLTDSLGTLLPGRRPSIRRLEAGVLKDPQELSWDGRDIHCLVIEYREPGGSKPIARTWVRQDDGLVLRQEATLQGDDWSLQREPR